MVEGFGAYGLEINAQKSHCWQVPKWKAIEEWMGYNDIFPMKIRIPYQEKFRYLGNSTNVGVRRDVNWEMAISKAKRLEAAITKALKGATVMPTIQKIQMISTIFDSAVLYGLGTVAKRHKTHLQELDFI